MKLSELNKTMNELGRFVLAVQELQQKAEPFKIENDEYFRSGIHTGAVKRASMDLSRSLVNLRNTK